MKILFKTFILFILSSNAFASDWEVVDFKKFVSLQYSGKITHGDKLNFNFSKKNCDRVNYYFSVYSAKMNIGFMKLKGKQIPLDINGIKTSAETIHVSPFLMGYRGMFYLGSYYANDLSKFFKRITSYQIKVVSTDDFKADAYFDIDFNQWDLGNSSDAFDKAYNQCKSKIS